VEQQNRFKRVALIVEAVARKPNVRKLAGDALVRIRVGLSEAEVRREVKQAGGWWDPNRLIWALRYDRVVA